MLGGPSQRLPPHVAREALVTDERWIADDDAHVSDRIFADIEAVAPEETTPLQAEFIGQFICDAGVDTFVDFHSPDLVGRVASELTDSLTGSS